MHVVVTTVCVQDKQAIVIKAEGEAKAAKLIGDQTNNKPSFVQLRRVEAAREIAHVISKSHNKVYLSSDALLLSVGADVEHATSSSVKK